MFNVAAGKYTISGSFDSVPSSYGEYKAQAALVEEYDFVSPDGSSCCVAVSDGAQMPFLVVKLRYLPDWTSGFMPGVLLVPETDVFFIGAGTRLLAYDLSIPKRLWEDMADTGFWGWTRHDDVVLMAAEIEFAAWNIYGGKLWSMFVEPPWEYECRDDHVHLSVMGEETSFPLLVGPVRG